MNGNILWALSIVTLYSMSASKLFYFTGGVFIGVNYHNHLKPYTDSVQTEAVKRLTEFEKLHPNLKNPILEIAITKTVETATPTVTRFDSIKQWFKKD